MRLEARSTRMWRVQRCRRRWCHLWHDECGGCADIPSLKETATATETSLTSVAFVAVTESQKAIATVTETNSTPSENVAGRVRLTPMPMASVTTLIHA